MEGLRSLLSRCVNSVVARHSGGLSRSFSALPSECITPAPPFCAGVTPCWQIAARDAHRNVTKRSHITAAALNNRPQKAISPKHTSVWNLLFHFFLSLSFLNKLWTLVLFFFLLFFVGWSEDDSTGFFFFSLFIFESASAWRSCSKHTEISVKRTVEIWFLRWTLSALLEASGGT